MAFEAQLTLIDQSSGTALRPSQTSGRRSGALEDVILIVTSSHRMTRPTSRLGLVTGRSRHEPFKFRKPLDAATPLIARAAMEGHRLTATVRYGRPNPTGDGTVERYFTVRMTGARVVKQTVLLPDVNNQALASDPMWEDVELVYDELFWRHEDGGIEHSDLAGG